MKKIKNSIKDYKAITLIALVITIIVLLILAGITVAQLSGNNLFENAKLAKEKYQKAREQEDDIIGDYEDAITGDRGNKVIYSTEEQVVGTWMNGETIYQKSLNITCTDGLKATITDLNKLVNYFGQISYSNYQYALPVSDPTFYGYLEVVGNNIYIRSSGLNNYSGVLTIQYTKTTD